jgi:hypothetical protein
MSYNVQWQASALLTIVFESLVMSHAVLLHSCKLLLRLAHNSACI